MENVTFWALMMTSIGVAVGHTLGGPDHYLPFIVLSKSRNWSVGRCFFWTFVCGIGHVASALILALVFVLIGRALDDTLLQSFDEYRGDVAAYLLIGFGLTYAAWGIRRAIRHREHSHCHAHSDGTEHEHTHSHHNGHVHFHPPKARRGTLAFWMMFIIFAFGPCEALWIVMIPAMTLGTYQMLIITLVFSVITILTMLVAVFLGAYGLKKINIGWLDRYSHAMAGAVILLCGIGIAFLGL